jgi:hypothetical protein
VPRTGPDGRATTLAIERLRPLVHAAGDLALDDVQAWVALCRRSWTVVADLIERGALPGRFELLPGDGPPSVANVLAEAWWYATSPVDLRHHRT